MKALNSPDENIKGDYHEGGQVSNCEDDVEAGHVRGP